MCSLFQFYNNWIDATGVSDMQRAGVRDSGRRLATVGYDSNVKPSAQKDIAGTFADSGSEGDSSGNYRLVD